MKMNKKKGLIIGGVALLTVGIIVALILAMNNGGDKKDNTSSKTTVDITTGEETTTDIETDTESTTEDTTEQATEENTTEETTTEETTTEEQTPSEDKLAHREVLKSEVFEVGYNDYWEAYIYMLHLYEKAFGYEDKYALIYFNDDSVPELVVDINSGITMYTYKDGKVYKLIDDWGYGAGGNHGYEYLPKASTIRNYNTDYAGLIMYETYTELTLDGETVVKTDTYLKQTFFDDVNGNGTPEDDEPVGEEYVHYYWGDDEITEDKYFELMVEGEYKNLQGESEIYNIYNVLEKPDLVQVKDEGCRKAYLEVIEQFENDTEEGTSTTYALIDFNGDDTLELVCQRGGHRISFYVYEDGKVYQLMDDWSWGAGANHGYEYIPSKNIYRNRDSNAGEHIISYRELKDNDLELMYYLVIEWGEYQEDGLDKYYKGTKDGQVEITEEEYNELLIEGNFRLIQGWYYRDEIESCLK